jgi:hypothetical protein
MGDHRISLLLEAVAQHMQVLRAAAANTLLATSIVGAAVVLSLNALLQIPP